MKEVIKLKCKKSFFKDYGVFKCNGIYENKTFIFSENMYYDFTKETNRITGELIFKSLLENGLYLVYEDVDMFFYNKEEIRKIKINSILYDTP